MPVNLLDGNRVDDGLGMPQLGGYSGSGTPGNLFVGSNSNFAGGYEANDFIPSNDVVGFEPSPNPWEPYIQTKPRDEDDVVAGPISDREGQDDVWTGASLADFIRLNPGLNSEDYLKWMASHNEEWAEKYVDYLVEKGSIDEQNAYTANREDTAYQRLVSDLQKAGLNPAMMYGSSASISASGSQGYVKMSEGANSRAIGNYSKLKKLVLSYLAYQLESSLGTANSIFKGINSIGSIIKAIFD